MSSLDSLYTRSLLLKGTIGQVADDQSVAIRLHAKTAAGAVTSVTTTIGTAIVAVTASGGTETWDFATYATVGAVADKINSSAYWECKVLDGLRSDASDEAFLNGIITASVTDGVTYYDVKYDTNGTGCLHMAYGLVYDRSVGQDKAKGSHRVHIQSLIYNVTCGGGADANGLKIYERVGTVETLLYQATPTSGAATTVTWASGNGKITSRDGADLIVKLLDATSITGELTVVGQLE